MENQSGDAAVHRQVAVIRWQIAAVTAAALGVFLFASEVLASVFNIRFVQEGLDLPQRLLQSFKPMVLLLYLVCTACIIAIVLYILRPLFVYIRRGDQYDRARSASVRLPVWIYLITLVFWVGGVTAYYAIYSFATPGGISFGWVLNHKLSAGIMCALYISLFIKVRLFRIKQRLGVTAIRPGEADVFSRNTSLVTALSIVYFLGVNIGYLAYFFSGIDPQQSLGFTPLTGIVFSGLLLGCLSLGASILSSSELHAQLVRMSGMLQHLATGDADLTRRMVVTNFDQLGELVARFNGFMERMQRDFHQLKQTARQVAAAAANLAEASVQLQQDATQQDHGVQKIRDAIHEFTGLMQAIQDDALNHRQVIQSHTRTGEAQAEGVRELADAARQLLERGREGVAQSDAGAEIIEQAIQAAAELNTALSSIAGVVHHTDELAQQIGGLLQTIDGIAQQTNLIAVNSSIEAAHAGSYGKGFAILAGEVRKLATQTGDAVRQIGDLMDQIHHGVQETARVAAGADETARISKQLSARSQEGLETIRMVLEHHISGLEDMQRNNAGQEQRASEFEQDVHRIADLADHIMQRAEQQSRGTRDISAAVEDIQLTNSRSVQGCQELHELASSLNSLGAQLERMVGGFATGEDRE
ncbi:methyl-accepting chemotaxis protein [Spirochaeta africana]|uniref:Methyl-accepting chemotaxis protein n=1 Tax=Spirochaeta africana (strain ATCC 700263 / DSM 8902 / Z-7692) TaxID=889378 RepID=H9UKP7_SPIAZ|nr:methyl-accepting chemotaxis protein [Spirochaeta africana]AFG38090.1 methyl-accepting chemotaxis protein [Spirochaeta africana DSM 8902]